MYKLRDYQIKLGQQAADIITQYNICYIAAEPRCGKTGMSMYCAKVLGKKNVLFITKLKAISSIEDDHKNFGFTFNLTIINYESLHKIDGDFDFLIIDESHRNGAFAVPSNSVYLIKKNWGDLQMILLSATPSAESFSQLYHQFYVSSFSPFKQWTNFYNWANAGFVTKKIKYVYNRQLNDYSDADKTKIDSLTKHLFISYSQAEAGFTEQVTEEILYVEMNPGTYRLADKLRIKKVHVGKEGEEILADTAVKLMNKLHQVYSGTVLCEDGKGICFDNSKAKFIKERFAGQKIAIFYKFKAEYGMLIATFGFDRITSDPAEFNSSDKIFVSQIQSGREGINLSSADCLVMLNIDFSSVSYWQARARMQSKERTKEAKLYWIFSNRGIEEKIYKAVMDKRDYSLSYFRKDFLLASYDKINNVTVIEKATV